MREDVKREDDGLPPGWVWTTFGQVAEYINGRAFKPSEWGTQGRPIIRIQNLTGSSSVVNRYDGPLEEKHIVRDGTLLISWSATLGAFIYRGEEAALNQHIFRVEPFIDLRYLYYLTEAYLASLKRQVHGSGMQHITKDRFESTAIALAPSAEQKRIVAVIEELFSDLDAGVAALKRVQANLKRYRASVLKAACEGRLVPTEAALAREEGRTYEPADVLLKRILAERRAKWEAEHPGKKYAEPAAWETGGLPQLPEGWYWARAEQLCDFITKGTTPAANKLFGRSGEIPFVKVYNLTFHGSLDFGVNPTFISRKTHLGELARSRVFPGDVLMNIVGPPLGKVSVVPNQYHEWNVNQAIAIFRPMPSYDRRFLSYCLMTEQILLWAIRRAKATAGQFNLTLEICRALPLPVPPVAEQQRIVAEVERRLSVVAELEAVVAANLARAGRLRQAVLKRAFEGKLTSPLKHDVCGPTD
jgi:type I restriction enzyme, S subunit